MADKRLEINGLGDAKFLNKNVYKMSATP